MGAFSSVPGTNLRVYALALTNRAVRCSNVAENLVILMEARECYVAQGPGMLGCQINESDCANPGLGRASPSPVKDGLPFSTVSGKSSVSE